MNAAAKQEVVRPPAPPDVARPPHVRLLRAEDLEVVAPAPPTNRALALLRLLRPHQWVKNLLLFAPLFLAHAIDIVSLATAALAFAAFSLCASAVYVINDRADVEADRANPAKARRPFAAGILSTRIALPLAALLLVGAFALAGLINIAFVAALAAYLVATTLYTFVLKRQMVADVLTLAGLYTLRLVAGGLATSTPVSEWLMAFSIFLFTSLAYVKRYSELARLAEEGHLGSAQRRGYVVGDLGLIESLGPASGYLAVVVMALYINSPSMQAIYPQAWLLWLICPCLLYWISRVWFLARRRELCEDPVVFAIKDPLSLLTAAAVIAITFAAAWPWPTSWA